MIYDKWRTTRISISAYEKLQSYQKNYLQTANTRSTRVIYCFIRSRPAMTRNLPTTHGPPWRSQVFVDDVKTKELLVAACDLHNKETYPQVWQGYVLPKFKKKSHEKIDEN